MKHAVSTFALPDPESAAEVLRRGAHRDRGAPCWELRGCASRQCPAYGNDHPPCWRVRGTLCADHGAASRLHKMEACLVCPTWVAHAEADPAGWSGFVARELTGIVEDLLEQSVENMEVFFQILTNLPDGLFTVDPENRINYFNPAAERLTGIPSAEAIGRYCWEVIGSEACAFDFSAASEPEDGSCHHNKEFEIRRGDGRSVPVLSSFSIIRDHKGNVFGGVEVFKDITVRKELEDELRKSEMKYRRIFEGSRDMILVISAEGKIKNVNQAGIELLRYRDKEELLGVKSAEEIFVHPLHAQVFRKQIKRWGFITDFETFFKTKDGVPVHCLLSGTAVRDERGEVLAYEGIAKDITARMDAVQSLKQRHRELSVLNAVALAINATQDLDSVLDTALKNVLEALGVGAGAVCMIDHRRASMYLKAGRGLPAAMTPQTCRITLRDRLLMRSLFLQDLSLAPEHVFPPFRASLEVEGAGGSLELTCFLINGREKARGFLAVDLPPSRHLTDQDLGLLGSLANFLGGAIENARLHQTIRQHREELKNLTAKLFHSQEFERKRIARELHDEAGQALTGINLALEAIDKRLGVDPDGAKELLAEVKRQVAHTYEEMRRISHRLHPVLLSDIGLEPALDAYFTRFARHVGLEIDFRVIGFESRPPPEVETTLYRLAQEAFNNTLKHSGAKRFRLLIVKSYPHIIFLAEDDGFGFDPKEVQEGQQSLGLVCMRERAAMLGGSFTLRTAAGAGTQIRIEIPVQE